MTISEGLGWLQTLKARHGELIALRNQNATRTRTRFGTDPVEVTEPLYDLRELDRRITLLAREIRLCDESVKRANAQTVVQGYERNDDVLGELV